MKNAQRGRNVIKLARKYISTKYVQNKDITLNIPSVINVGVEALISISQIVTVLEANNLYLHKQIQEYGYACKPKKLISKPCIGYITVLHASGLGFVSL